MRASAEAGVRREETLVRLQRQLDDIGSGGAASVELDGIVREIRTLRTEQDSSEAALRQARHEADSLRELISDRQERLKRLEDRVKLASGRKFRRAPKRSVVLAIVSLLAMSIILLRFYRLGYFEDDPTAPVGVPTRVVTPSAALDPVEPAEAARENGRPESRIVRFPMDRALGTLSIRPWDNAEAEWRVHGDARGPMSLGGDHVLKLSVPATDTPDLSALASLDPNALFALELNGETIVDAQMNDVAKLTGLHELTLRDTRITSQGIKLLAGMTELRALDLRGTPLSPGAGAALAGFTGLEKLDVGATGLASGVIQKLTETLPNCTIVAK